MRNYFCLLWILSIFKTSFADQRKTRLVVELGKPMHLACNLPETFTDYIMATFKLMKKGKVLSTCRTVIMDGGSQCSKSNNTDQNIKWGLMYHKDNLDAVEAIKVVTSPMDAGVYSCNLELLPKLSKHKCSGVCQDRSSATFSEIEISPPIHPVPMINHEAFQSKEFQMTQSDTSVGCFFDSTNKKNQTIFISDLNLSTEPNELFDLTKGNTHYLLKCCAEEQCLSIKLNSNNSSHSKKFYLPVRDFQFKNIVEKSGRIIQKKKGDICGAAPAFTRTNFRDIESVFKFLGTFAAIVVLSGTLAANLVIATLTA